MCASGSAPRRAASITCRGLPARDLGLEVTAEGVETPAQLQRLAEAGCQVFQGFVFSPALPPEQVAAFIAQGPAPG